MMHYVIYRDGTEVGEYDFREDAERRADALGGEATGHRVVAEEDYTTDGGDTWYRRDVQD